MLLPFIERATETDVVIFDAPGAGHSAAPALPWRFSDHADAAAEVLDQLGYETANVLGLSWGGALAQQFARQHPDRCERLILAATTAGQIMLPGRWDVLMRMSNPRRYFDKEYMKKIAGTIYGGSFRTNKLTASQYAEATSPPSSRGYYYQMMAIMGWTSLPWLHRLPQPTLVLQGRDDPLIPVINGKMLAAMIPDARYVEVDCGHLFLITRATEVAGLITDFILNEPVAASKTRLQGHRRMR